MPVLIIQTNPDGSVSIAAPAQVPPDLMADAETVASLDEAAQVLQDVLGAEQAAPGEQQQDPGRVADESVPGQSGDGDVTEDAMAQGFQNVRGAPRR